MLFVVKSIFLCVLAAAPDDHVDQRRFAGFDLRDGALQRRTNFGGFFWPIFPILGWGIGIFFHGWDVYQGPPTEQRIHEEMERLEGRSTSLH